MASCNDCKLYLPVDVFSGLCKLDKKEILPDDDACGNYQAVPKCKHCMNYKSDREHLGTCMGTTIAYPEMMAAKCADFKWISQN
jgi:4-hydroxyphenylacetate decarboxylase small subunit